MAPIAGRRHSRGGGQDGAIAQLGERIVRNDEVGGSIPPGSTSLRSLRELRLGKPAPDCSGGTGGAGRAAARGAEGGLYQLPSLLRFASFGSEVRLHP